METAIYNQEGKETGKIALPDNLFGAPANNDLLHQVVTSMRSNARRGTAHAKNRGEVRGGGKKPWRQKGTGRARHGSSRSPIWIGGGVTHGPRNDKIWTKTIPKRMAARALVVALSEKARDGDIICLNNLAFKAPKTREAMAVLRVLSQTTGKKELKFSKGKRALLIESNKDANTEKSFRNIPITQVTNANNVNLLDVMNFKNLIFVEPAKCFEILEKRIKAK